jgi:hypothetical protein
MGGIPRESALRVLIFKLFTNNFDCFAGAKYSHHKIEMDFLFNEIYPVCLPMIIVNMPRGKPHYPTDQDATQPKLG